MNDNAIIFSIFLIFSGAALLSTVALYTRQALLVAYIFLGLLLGPWGLKLIVDINVVHKIGDIGIIFLLFLLGLNLHPQDLLRLFKKTFWITLLSSIVFLIIGFSVSCLFGFSIIQSLVVGVAVTFSSTIIGLKLLPTTVLHHQHTGELVVSILLLQDLLAIFVMLLMHIGSIHGMNVLHFSVTLLSLPFLFLITFLFEKFILAYLFAHFDKMREYLFLLAIAWCLSISELAKLLGLSYEIGAFVAGISIATGPIAFYISESLKPVRDFFLVLFFFSIGADFDLHYFPVIIAPAVVLAGLLMMIKPLTFRVLLGLANESRSVAWEIGVRLGQTSSFSLLVTYVALQHGLINTATAYLVQAITLITFIVSSTIIVLRYPTPIAISDKLRRD
ncbi:MAG: sodium:proton antiporter [Coxiella sp. DG_40]|nr:MAG: sodium:proton antiporter [Coxiella sp. DG_40]